MLVLELSFPPDLPFILLPLGLPQVLLLVVHLEPFVMFCDPPLPGLGGFRPLHALGLLEPQAVLVAAVESVLLRDILTPTLRRLVLEEGVLPCWLVPHPRSLDEL